MATKYTRPDADVCVAISVHTRLKILAAKRRKKLGWLASKIIGDELDRLDRLDARKARKAGR